MDCPRCDARDVSGPECPSCGVILARARPRTTRPAARPASRAAAPGRAGTMIAVLLVLAAGAVIAVRVTRHPPTSERAGLPPPAAESADEAPGSGDLVLPDPRGSTDLPLPAPSEAAPVEVEPLAADTSDADRATAERLLALLSTGGHVGDADIAAAEDLHARYGEQARTLLEALLVAAANRARGARQFAPAEAYLHRAAAVSPRSLHPLAGLLDVYLDTGDWRSAERAARDALSLGPPEAATVRGLAYALVRQDRSREAVDVLSDYLDGHPDPGSQALLDKLQRDTAPEGGLTEQRLAHFHVRYDGEAHVDVGRAVLLVLDRHYARLVRTFDHEPRAAIPVILLTRQRYDEATGAPGWSGGQYDSFDGRVRIPVGGLTAALTPDLDGVVLHELTHAFVAEQSAGVAPREIQEGLAQHVEGKTAEGLVGEAGLRALADGRLRGVAGFYVASLSLVEHLMGQRGQGGINDLLEAMAETGNADQAFERVYGRNFAGVRREWEGRLRLRHGS